MNARPAALAIGGCAIVVLLALLALATRDPLGRLPAGLKPADLSLVVITLDTTRADRIGCYGATQVATPNLDRLAASGTLFERAIAPTPLTLPSHSTLFTGLLPGSHGVRDNGGFRLGAEHVTLAEVLAARGYATGGFVAAYVLDRRWGIAQGFERYFDDFDLARFKSPSMGDIQRRGDEVAKVALGWIEEQAGNRFFAWVHLYDPHAPYDPPEPFRSEYRERPYNGEIAWTDAVVGQVLDGLARLGRTGSTLIAVIGDHGESLGEHGESGHGFFVYAASTRVPFLLAGPYPGLAGRRVGAVVGHADLAPTLLDLLGSDERLAGGDGRSLRPLLGRGDDGDDGDDDRVVYSEAFFSRFHYGWSELKAVRTRRWSYIAAPRPELYDLAVDPGETDNLAEEHPETAARLAAEIARIGRTRSVAAAAPIEEDEETLRKLAALGYVGSVSLAGGDAVLADPKDKVGLYHRMDRARHALTGDDLGAAIALLDAVVGEDPGVVDAWYMLGNAHYQRRDWEQAATSYRRALAERPDHDFAMIGLADTLLATGHLDDALAGYRRFLAQDPHNGQIAYRLAQLLLDHGRDEEAARAFRETLTVEPRAARAEVGLAVIAFRSGDPAGAERAIERALSIDPKARNARYNLALLREEQGDLVAAVAAYRAEIEAHPEAFKAHFNLGRLLARSGDRSAAVAALRAAVAVDPDSPIGRLFLAQALSEQGDDATAASEARRGLELGPESDFAPLGHYVLADLHERAGRRAEARRELELGRELETRSRHRVSSGGMLP